MRVRILTYNLFWWNLFGRRGGNHGSAGKLIRRAAGAEPFELMAFQECDDTGRVMRDAGLAGEYTYEVRAGLPMAYRTVSWRKLAAGVTDVSEDKPWMSQVWRRRLHWMRLQHRGTGKHIFFANHHGPLPVGSGGTCGGRGTALKMLKAIAENAHTSDLVVLTGDFNAGTSTSTASELETRMHRIFSGRSHGGVDHFFSNCGASTVAETKNLGSGGSDHDALMAIFTL